MTKRRFAPRPKCPDDECDDDDCRCASEHNSWTEDGGDIDNVPIDTVDEESKEKKKGKEASKATPKMLKLRRGITMDTGAHHNVMP